VCRNAAKCIPSCRGAYNGTLIMDMHSLETLESQKSKLMNQVLALFL
jgi:hypothetical protein